MTDIPYISEFRSPAAVRAIAEKLSSLPPPEREMTIMEVCGTHTMSIFRFGIRQLLPPWLRLVSGPGCPVCVTDDSFIIMACRLALDHGAIIVTFGDLMTVPGADLSLEKARSLGADVRVVYSPHQCLEICHENPEKQVVYLAVGFETTAPLTASLIQDAARKSVENLSLLIAHKLVPPAMVALLSDPELSLDGFICPPHVSAIIGANAFTFIPEMFQRPCVVAGFEAADIMLGLLDLVEQRRAGRAAVSNCYRRVVTDHGNLHAQGIMNDVYAPMDDSWRGLGTIPLSGLKIRPAFEKFDAMHRFSLTIPHVPKTACRCGDVLRGVITPRQCPLFESFCNPDNPVGPCMVSSEGTCAAYYKYDR